MTTSNIAELLDDANESSSRIQKLKEKLRARPSLRSVQCLTDLSTLTVFLVSQDRLDEAVRLAVFVSESVAFSGNFDIWSPVHLICYAGAYACHRCGNEDYSNHLFAKAEPHGDFPPLPAFRDLDALKRELQNVASSSRAQLVATCLSVKFQVYEIARRGFPTEPITLEEASQEIKATIDLILTLL